MDTTWLSMPQTQRRPDNLRLVGIPITDVARVAHGGRHRSSASVTERMPVTRRGGRVLDEETGHLPDGICPWLPQRSRRACNATTNCFRWSRSRGRASGTSSTQRGEFTKSSISWRPRNRHQGRLSGHRVEESAVHCPPRSGRQCRAVPAGLILDIPAAVFSAGHDAAAAPRPLRALIDPASRQLPAPEAVDRAIDLLASAQRPLWVGQGRRILAGDKQIRAFIEASLLCRCAKGLLPDDHPQS